MTYQLAKQLKDAGFKQSGNGYILEPANRLINEQEAAKEQCYAPTLSELIEACGDNFYDLVHRVSKVSKKMEWVASVSYGMEKPPELGWGATPEEAVAKLWFALNDKE